MDQSSPIQPVRPAPVVQNDFAKAFAKTGTSPMSKAKNKKALYIAGGVIGVIVLLFAIVGFVMYGKVKAIMNSVDQTKAVGMEAYAALKTQNLPLADQKLTETTEALTQTQKQVQGVAFLRYVPIAGAYYGDSEHAFKAGFAGIEAAQRLVKELEPYADVLGFTGQGTFSGGSAEDRIAKIVDTLGKVTPALDDISADLKVLNTELSQIDEKKYPTEIKGIAVQSLIAQAKEFSKAADEALTQQRPAIEALPKIAGADQRQKYLVLFQNSGELRPTGGFMTAYAIINVEKGKVEPESSGDIYELDQKFTGKPAIPAILGKFLTTETKWNLRDMNISPDFKESMDTFNTYYQKTTGHAVGLTGIIAVDTHFLESLVKILGPVEVPGYGTFSAENDARCDCPQIIYALSEIVDRPTPYLRENRKGILGPMMKSILTKSYGAPKQLWPDLFSTGWKDIQGKDVQFYFFDSNLQAAAEAIDAAGRIQQPKDGEDYLTIVDANLAGAKSNFFVTSTVEHEVTLSDGKVNHIVTVTYKNPFKASNCNLEAGQLCLNGTLNDWVRFYLPQGATVVSTQGLDAGSESQSEELGHAVVGGIFKLQPLSQAKIVLTYQIPYQDSKQYKLYMQKQGGTDPIKQTFMIGNAETQEATLEKDTHFVYSW